MVNYLEILRLSSLCYSQRTIESTAHCSKHTVRSVLQAAQANGIAWPLDGGITNADLEALLFPAKYQNTCTYTEPNYAYIHRELAKPRVTLDAVGEILSEGSVMRRGKYHT